jgi:branched-chain amino acid transport system ATP-binding protein
VILELKNISFSFKDSNFLLNNLCFTLDDNSINAIIGANGSGKTTLLNIISGFLKPKKGEIYLKGKDISKILPFERNTLGIGRIFQDLRIIRSLTVKENIILSIKNNPTDLWYNSMLPQCFFKNKIEEYQKIAEELIETYYLNEIKNYLASDISFGQQKLLSLACCEANDPDLFLLDEPVAGINPEYIKQIGTQILKLKNKGKTIFLIEHNTEFISGIADNLFFLNQGYIKNFNSLNSLINDKNVREAYL